MHTASPALCDLRLLYSSTSLSHERLTSQVVRVPSGQMMLR